jgi:putative PIN family toxin of toxin-antitoxin system
VLRLVLVEHELVTAEIILEEVERVIMKKPNPRREDLAYALALLRDRPVQPTATAPRKSPVRDPDDARVLATALAAGADILVTGDSDLLDVRDRIEGIVVADPRGFWEMNRSTAR